MSEDPKLSALRLPVDLHTKIVAAAVENGRSRHAEMLHRLESTFNTPDAALAKAQLDRLEAKLDAMNPERSITSMKIQLSPEDEQSLMDYLASPEGSARGLFQIDEDHYVPFRRFESAGWKGTRSPTGRLSESQPELQDLPSVSGMSTLAATFRRHGCMCGGGLVGATAYAYRGDEEGLQSQPLNFGGFYNGGFCGIPEGELPKILERGEPVIDWSKYQQMAGRGYRWVENTSGRPLELAGDVVIELLTRPHRHLTVQRVGDIHPADWVSSGGGKLPRIICWRPLSLTVNVVNTADTSLADAEKMAGPYGFNGNYDGWTVNPGDYPAEHGTKVDVLFQDGGRLYNQDVVSISWVSNKVPSLNVTHWRLAE